MSQLLLTEKTQNKILNDQELLGKVAKCLGLSVITTQRLVTANDARLTQASVLQIIADHTGEDKTTNLLQETPAKKQVA